MEEQRSSWTSKALLNDDKYFDAIEIKGILKPGMNPAKDNPWALECAVIKHLADTFKTVIEYYEGCLKVAYAKKEDNDQSRESI